MFKNEPEMHEINLLQENKWFTQSVDHEMSNIVTGNDKSERMWNGAIVAYFKTLAHILQLLGKITNHLSRDKSS